MANIKSCVKSNHRISNSIFILVINFSLPFVVILINFEDTSYSSFFFPEK